MTPVTRRLPLILALAGACVLAAGPSPGQDAGEKEGRWEKEIRAFERQDEKKAPPQDAVLFVGSSSIRLWDLPRYFPGREVINRGFGGSELADSVRYAPRIVVKHHPRVVVLYAGDNDLAGGKSPDQVFADFKAFVRVVREGLPRAKLVYISIKPSIKRWGLVDKARRANALIRAHCEGENGLVFLDVFPPMLGKDGKPRPELFVEDGLHMTDAGYRLWTALLGPHLQ